MSPFRSSPFRACPPGRAGRGPGPRFRHEHRRRRGARGGALVISEKGVTSSVFVTNVETYPIKVELRYVGDRNGPAPGMRICGTFVLPASQERVLDMAPCQLPHDPGAGMVVLIENHPGIARLSARAWIDSWSPTTSGAILGTTARDRPAPRCPRHDREPARRAGAALEGRRRRQHTTDCFFGAFFDGSGFGGMVGRLT